MFKHYLTTALRILRSAPYMSGVHIVGLSLGLACFIGAYAAVEYIDSSDRQFATADRAFAITQRVSAPARGFDTGARPSTSPVVAQHLAQEMPELEAVARVESLVDLNVSIGAAKARLDGAAADRDFLRIFPFEMLPGAKAETLHEPRSAVLTAETAQRLFNSTDVIGRKLTIGNAIDVYVTGVIATIPSPSQFDHSPLSFLRFDLLVSMDVLDELAYLATGRRASELPTATQWARISGPTYVLLPHSGVVTRQALDNVLANFAEKYVPKERRDIARFEFNSIPVAEVWKSGVNAALFRGNNLSVTELLMVLGCLVLAIACLNYANLATAGAAARLKEIGMRRVLGASGRQVVAQCVVEVLAFAFLALGVALALLLAISPLAKSAAGVDLLSALTTDASIWAYIGAALLATGLLAGAYPALVMARIRPANAMRQSLRAQSTLASRLLVGVQFGTASLLLISVVFVFSQSRELREKGLGASASQTLIISNRVAKPAIDFEVLRTELQRIPGVESVAAVDNIPWGYFTTTGAVTRDLTKGADFISPFTHTVTPGFERTLGMEIIAGRGFDPAYGDDFIAERFPAGLNRLDASHVYGIVIDRQLASKLGWDDPALAVNQIVGMPYGAIGGKDIKARIVGVIENRPLRLFGAGTTTNLFMSAREISGYPVVRIRGNDVPATLKAIDLVWDKLAPDTVLQRRFMDEQFEQSYQLFDRLSRVITGVTIFAFLISIMGLFGMAIFIASRRCREIGVRKTLGATVNQILVLLLRDFSKPIVIANIAIWPLGYLAANAYLGTFTHRIAITPLPFVGSLVLTVLVAWLAVGGQAMRAARLNPATVLRYE